MGSKSPRLIIKEGRNGKGLFAKRNFRSGDIIFEVKGKLISCDEEEDVDEKTRSNAFRFDEEKYISPQGELGDFINHSCVPNCYSKKIKGKLFILSLKNIEPEKELLIDYSTIIADDDSWVMECNCARKNCRKKISKFILLTKKLQNKYIKLGIVPDYIYKI